MLRLLHLVHQNIKLLFFYEFYIHKIRILFKSYFYGNFKFFYFTKSTKKKYYAVDVRNSCNTTCSVSFCLAKKEKIFSRTFRFLHFFVRTFSFFTFSGAWKTTKAFFFCLSLFLLVLRSFLFLPSRFCLSLWVLE